MRKIIVIFFLLMSVLTSKMFSQRDTLKLHREARSLVREGNKLYKQQKFADASIAYRKALDKNSKYSKATYNLGNTLYQEKKYKEAVPQYELTAKTANDKFTKAEAFHNIGNAMMEQKQYGKAVDAYKNSLRNNPKDNETRYNLAVAKKELKKQQQKNQKNDIKPSEYAKKMKARADDAVLKNNFKKAFSIMEESFKRDKTTQYYKDYIKRLNDINEINK